jgi:hypothetical protein
MKFINFPPPAEFIDRRGKVRTISTCSVVGITEFEERLKQIQEWLKGEALEGETWQTLYKRDQYFRHLVDRCLKLNGIQPKWITLDQVEQLLFYRFDSEVGEHRPGWLLELNGLKDGDGDTQQAAPADPLSLEEIIAVISLSTNGLEEAVQLASTLPASSMHKIISARAELTDPKAAEKRRFKKVKAKFEADRTNYDRIMQMKPEEIQGKAQQVVVV